MLFTPIAQIDIANNLLNSLAEFSLRIPGVLLILVVGYIAATVLGGVLNRLMLAVKVQPTVASLVVSVLRVVLWIVVLAAALQVLGLNEVALALSGSIGLVALGLATAGKDTVSDILAGLFLISDPDFKAGYKVKTGDMIGRIHAVDLRKTRITGEDGKTYVIPNHTVEGAPWSVEDRGTEPAVSTATKI